jgi:hypothetical protein
MPEMGSENINKDMIFAENREKFYEKGKTGILTNNVHNAEKVEKKEPGRCRVQ